MKLMLVSICILLTMVSVSTVQAEEIILSTGSGLLDSVINPVKEAFEKESGIASQIMKSPAAEIDRR